MEFDRPFYDLLPELYKQDKLMDAVIATFEEQFLKIEKMIDELPDTLYDPARTTDKYMDFLWELFGLEACGKIFSRKQKRALLPVTYALQRWKGTRSALDWILKAFLSDLCGYWVSPVIIEYESWGEHKCSEKLRDMYHDRFGGEDDFVVLIPPEPALQETGVKERIQTLIEEYSPADTIPRMFGPEPQNTLGQNAYMGFGLRI